MDWMKGQGRDDRATLKLGFYYWFANFARERRALLVGSSEHDRPDRPQLRAWLTRERLWRTWGATMDAVPPSPGSNVHVGGVIDKLDGKYPPIQNPTSELSLELAIAQGLSYHISELPADRRNIVEAWVDRKIQEVFGQEQEAPAEQ